jgi:drug/metabolite transporter (DMT)-like permease
MPEGVGRMPGRPGVRNAALPQAGRSQAAVLAAAYGAVLLWGATPMVTKIAVADVSPLAVGLLRTLCGALVALPLLAAGRFRAPGGRAGRLALAVSAFGGFVVFPVLFSLGLGRTSAGHGALLLGILPVLTGLIAALVEKRVPGARWWLGCAVAVAGTALLVGARFDLAAGESSWLGDTLVLTGAVAAAAGYVAGAIAAREIGTWPVTLWGLTIGGTVLLPIAPFVLSPAALAGASAFAQSAIVYLALGSSIVAYAAWYWALGHGGIGRTGLAQFAQPIIGLVLAVGLLGEALTWPMTLAAATILGGVALARGGK